MTILRQYPYSDYKLNILMILSKLSSYRCKHWLCFVIFFALFWLSSLGCLFGICSLLASCTRAADRTSNARDVVVFCVVIFTSVVTACVAVTPTFLFALRLLSTYNRKSGNLWWSTNRDFGTWFRRFIINVWRRSILPRRSRTPGWSFHFSVLLGWSSRVRSLRSF